MIIRSVFDRTLFVLGRAAAVAAPAGLVIWVLANVTAGGVSLLAHVSGALDPFARLLGLDGVILLAFILGFPANEIVIPIAAMAYLSTGTLADLDGLALHALLLRSGWTPVTALCTVLFSLFHWPCSTTCLTIRRETGSLRWTFLAMALPTAVGMGLCFLTASCARAAGLSRIKNGVCKTPFFHVELCKNCAIIRYKSGKSPKPSVRPRRRPALCGSGCHRCRYALFPRRAAQ